MKKEDCRYYIEMLAKFLLSKRSHYSQQMYMELKKEPKIFNICCGNDELDIHISIRKKFKYDKNQ